MLEDANSSDYLLLFYHTHFTTILTRTKVTRVADDLFRLDSFVTTPNPDELAIGIRDDLVNLFVEHVGTTVDSA